MTQLRIKPSLPCFAGERSNHKNEHKKNLKVALNRFWWKKFYSNFVFAPLFLQKQTIEQLKQQKSKIELCFRRK